jgi:hypothetical protein
MNSDPNEIPVRRQLRAFARLLLPLFQEEFEHEISSPKPSWMYAAILHRRMRELEQQAQ